MLLKTLRLLVPAGVACIAGLTPVSLASAAVAPTPAAIVFGSCPQKPVWPAAALEENRQGAVRLAFHIDTDNAVIESKIITSSGHADLDEAARVGLAKCKFRAATQDGAPVREWAELTY